jgi:hypothetical protein
MKLTVQRVYHRLYIILANGSHPNDTWQLRLFLYRDKWALPFAVSWARGIVSHITIRFLCAEFTYWSTRR